jgi:hypothetical protein
LISTSYTLVFISLLVVAMTMSLEKIPSIYYCLITSCQTHGHVFIIMLPPSCESADVLISLQAYFELVSNANN